VLKAANITLKEHFKSRDNVFKDPSASGMWHTQKWRDSPSKANQTKPAALQP
jgi:hypothetical protein